MRRKIVRQANQAHTITLPISWVRSNGLDKKEAEVNIDEAGKALIITNTGKVASKKVKLVIEDERPRALWGKFNALYANGIDEIEITSNKEISSLIISSIEENLGYALVSQDKNTYLVKDISGTDYSNIDEIFKRVFQMVLMFFDSAIKDVFGEEKETETTITKRDSEINKFCLYLERAINKMSYSDQIKGRILFAYSFMLEKISDEILRLWRTNIQSNVRKTEKLKEIVNISRQEIDLLFDFYYTFNPEIAFKIHDLKEKARKIDSTLSKIDSPTSRFLHYALQIIEDVADLTHLNLMMGL